MPKLAKSVAAKAAQEAENWGDRTPLAPGEYLARLVKVTAKDGAKGTYWSWEFDVIGTDNKLWENTSLSEKAIGRLGKVFEAFGVPTTTDTDDLIGRLVGITVTTSTIQAGERKGEMRAEIAALYPASRHPDFEGDDKTSAADLGVDEDEEPF